MQTQFGWVRLEVALAERQTATCVLLRLGGPVANEAVASMEGGL